MMTVSKAAAFLTLLALLCGLLHEGQAFQWTSPFEGGQFVYACVGKTVTFPFEYTLEEGEKIIFTRWTFDGLFTSDTIATLTPFPELFQPSPEYSKRISQVGNAGLTLSQLRMKDNGNYSVEISGVTSSGAFFSLHGMAVLQLGDNLMADNQEVKVTQMQTAVKDKDTNLWSVALACGKFTHLSLPPFPVYWMTPSGDVIKESSSYQDGHYILVLPNPVRGGNYSCEVPQLFSDEACLSAAQSQSKAKDTVLVDEVHARLTLLEANQMEVMKKTSAAVQDLQSTATELQSKLASVTALESKITSTVAKLDSKMASAATELESKMASTVTELSEQVDFNISTAVTELESKVTSTVTELETMVTSTVTELSDKMEANITELDLRLEDVATPRIGFNAQSTRGQKLSPPSHVQFHKVLYNQGNGYDVNTGDFVAPMNGTYFFIFHTQSGSSSYTASSYMMANDKTVCTTWIYTQYDHGSCHAVVHLTTEHRVWVVPYSSNKYYQGDTTSFAGYLISDDPM